MTGIVSAVLFTGAAMLSQVPALPAPDVPSATDVRAARDIALALARSVVAANAVPMSVTESDMNGAARVLADGLPRLRVASSVSDTALTVRGSLQLTNNTWLNGALRMAEADARGYPDLSARIGAVPIPKIMLDPLLVLVHRAAVWRARTRFPTPREAIVAFEARRGMALAQVDLPRGLLKGVSKLAPTPDDAIDAARTNALYAAAMDALGDRAAVDLADVYAVMFAEAPQGEDARAVMVAAAMVTVGPRVRRLVGAGDAEFLPRLPATLKVSLAGRDDLAKHFTLSAALAAAAEPGLGRALGTWKELDDSLAGGSGFSFVDVAADRAGLRLGQAARDPRRARRIAQAFRRGTPDLLPMSALGFDEGLGDHDFTRRYGNIATDEYDAAVARIDRALDTLPIMRR